MHHNVVYVCFNVKLFSPKNLQCLRKRHCVHPVAGCALVFLCLYHSLLAGEHKWFGT